MKIVCSTFLAICILLMFYCSIPTKYNSPRKTPFPPVIDSIYLTTKDDTLPCIRILYTYTDSLHATLRLYRKEPWAGSFSLLVHDIPMQEKEYSDVVKIDDTLSEFINTFSYRMTAVSPEDSASQYSEPDSISLVDLAPKIESINISSGHPVVSYFIDTRSGVDWTVEIVKHDSVIAYYPHPQTLAGNYFTWAFLDVDIALLKTRSEADATDNGTYGVRIIVRDVTDVYGIAVGKFNVKNL